MTELVKSDIFFFITGGSIVVVTIVILIALYYIVKILRDVEDITESVRGESKRVVEDVSFVRRNLEKSGRKIKSLITKSPSKKKKASKKNK